MKKLLILVIFLTAGIVTTHAQSTPQPKTKTDTTMKTVYTCTMHPEVISDKPGTCPKCGMTLVAKKVPVKQKPASAMPGMKMDGMKQ